MRDSILELYDWAAGNPALVISGLSLAVATLTSLLTHFARLRGGFRQLGLSIGGWLGLTSARYDAAFLKKHRKLHNIYLNRIEELDILSTYVPLNVMSDADSPGNLPAIKVLLDAGQDRIIVLGHPGSGKTTLLKSFGVGLVSHEYQRKRQGRKTQETKALEPKADFTRGLTPIYVELRHFAGQLGKYPTLAEYIVGHVLSEHLGVSEGKVFLHKLLSRGKCVVLLDALDEVGTDEYEAVRRAIRVFLSDTSEALPTARARVVLTSRYQNFLNISADWIPAAFPPYYVLSPFSDDDIQRFLNRRARDMPDGKTPAALWEEIQDSNTLELHRTPLILTISLGLYKSIPRYTIPESIALFYDEITKELLQRHDFRTRGYLFKRNIFQSGSKLQFLREFALTAATRLGRFDEFTYGQMEDAFKDLALRNSMLSDDHCESFLGEIIDNAGLLRRVSDSGIYVFAHRSFHEYFVALQLSKKAEQGGRELIARAEDSQWRQVTVFFAAMDHGQQDLLLRGLAEKNPELAGHCLAVTINVSPEVAELVVESLSAIAARSNAISVLGALSAICRSAGKHERERALDVIGCVLSDVLILEDTSALSGLTRDDLVSLARNLAATGAPDIVKPCVTLSHLVEDDPRIVTPLLDCLVHFRERRDAPEARQLVKRLLELAQTPDGFEALQADTPLSLPFVTEELRSLVYPFKHLPGRDSNLVTLLAWAHAADAMPERRNGFLEAFRERQSSPGEWQELEHELEKTPLTIKPYRLGLFLFLGGAAACALYLLRDYYTLSPAAFSERHFLFFTDSWLKWLFAYAVSYALGLLVGIMQEMFAASELTSELALASSSRYLYDLSSGIPDRPPANPLPYWTDDHWPFKDWLEEDGSYSWDESTIGPLLLLSFAQLPFVLAGAGLFADGGTLVRLASMALLSVICFWLPATQIFLPGKHFDFRRRGRLANLILGDASSRLWVQKSV